jgi:predicted aspartyl protease
MFRAAWRPLRWAFLTGLLAGCSIVSSPVGVSVEKRLRTRQMSETEFGARVADGGKTLHFTMFTGQIAPGPVAVPMHTSFRGLPGLDVRFNSRRTVRMLADTGAQLSIVDAASVLDSAGKIYVPEKWNFTVTGIGGDEHAWLARFDRVEIGPIDLHSFTTIVRRERTVIRMAGIPVGKVPINLLGCPILLGFSYVTFDYANKQFVFSPGAQFQPPPGARRIPLTVRDQLIYVPLRIGSRTIQAMVDTGAKDELFLNSKTVREFGLADLASGGGSYRALGLGGETSGRQFALPLAFVGDLPLRALVVDTNDSDAWTARIGGELLERWKVTFDFRGGAMWLE